MPSKIQMAMRRLGVFTLLGNVLIQNFCHAFAPIYVDTKGHGQIAFSKDATNTDAESDKNTPVVEDMLLLKPMEQEIQGFNMNFSIDRAADAKRIFHGRGGCYSGSEHLTLDWFPPVWLLTSHNIPMSNDTISSVHDMLKPKKLNPPTDNSICNEETVDSVNLVYQFRNDTGSETRVVSGDVPKPHVVAENGVKFLVGLASGKNNGIFLDMANGRKWVQDNTKDQNVLNMFAYTCGFSVAALAGGASQVVNIDMAGGPMKNGKRNHELNNLQGARFLTHNIFKTWGKLRKLGPYDTIIVDPPSFQRNSFVASKDYCKILRRLPDLLTNNGKVLLCLNAPSLDSVWLKNQVQEEAPSLEFLERLPNPESFPDIDSERSLKVLLFQKKSSVATNTTTESQ